MRKWLASWIFLWLIFGSAQARFEFTPVARNAYEQVLSLRFEQAKVSLAQMKLQDTDNLIAYHIENYVDFLTLYLNQNEADYERLKKNEELRLEKIQHGDAKSPYYLYTQANVRLQWALVKLRFGDYISAFNDISKANKLLEKNQEKFPDFLPNLKDLGILHALVGTIPDNYKWSVRLLGGLKGTVAQGQRELHTVLQKAKQQDFIFKTETAVMLATIMLYLDSNSEGAWQLLNNISLQPLENPLHCFVMANVAMRSGRNDRAIELLQHYPKGKQFATVSQFDFLLGLAKLRRLDSDAGKFLEQFVQQYRGQDGVKEAYQKLAWFELTKGNTQGYQKYVKAILVHGKAASGGDKDALQEAKTARVLDVNLIRARLLFDGGYYQKAYQQLQDKSSADFTQKASRLEYLYRMGRILHGLQKYDEALGFYWRTIEQGKDELYFYACNAALQAGLICESRKEFAKAKEFYQHCLTINPVEYKTELHQKAKSGLERLKG